MLTCVDFLQRLVGEEAETSVRHNTQDGGGEASVERLQTLLSGYPHKHVENVAVPVSKQETKPHTLGHEPGSAAGLTVLSQASHLLGRDGHPGSNHVQRVGQHGCGGAGQRARH